MAVPTQDSTGGRFVPEAAGEPTLVGRADELAALLRVVDRARHGQASAVVLRGEAGIGKTALLDRVAAGVTGVQVTRLAGLESETHLEFAGIHRLLVPYLGLLDTLPATQVQALRTAMGLIDGPPANSFMLGVAVLAVLSHATRDDPLLVLVDDAQWLDPESVEILGFVARRLHAEKLGLIFCVREPSVQPLLEGIPAVSVGGLSRADAVGLLVRLAPDHVDRRVAEQVAVQSRGNPLVIVEVSKEHNIMRTSRSLLLDDPLPMSQRLEKHFSSQIRSLSNDCQQILLYAAAHADPDVRVLQSACALEGVDPEAVEEAVAAGLVHSSPEFQFRHPLIRSAVYSNAGGPDRRRVHSVLARLTDPQREADLRAWHLAAAAAGPDEEVAAALEAGARAARGRGGYLSESAYLARAAELSPDSDRRAARLLRAAEAALTGGAPLRAQALLAAGLPHSDDEFLQAQLKKLQANALHRAGDPGRDTPATLVAAAEVFASIDAALARETMLEALEQTCIRGALIEGITPFEVGRAALALASSEDSLTDALLRAAGTYFCSGFVEAAPLIRAALVALARPDALDGQVPRWFCLGLLLAQLVWDERAAHGWLVRCEELARRTGAVEYLTMTLMPLSGMEVVLGRLGDAAARVDDLRRLSLELGMDEQRVRTIENARLLAWLGRDQPAREAAERTHQLGAMIGAGNFQRLAQQALLVVELGRSRYGEAYRVSGALIADEPLALTNDALPNLIEAAARSGHRTEAMIALGSLRTRATASGTQWALGLLARSEAVLAADDQAERHFLAAVQHFDHTAVDTERARTHLLFGEWLRRRRRRTASRDHLRVALALFDDMGAAAFADRARSELAATGERDNTSRGGLTPQEAQIASLAASGATNSEIAGTLFLSPHTVEYHLRKVYRKLDVASRKHLPDLLK